jgi:hypothetical protein
MKWNLITHKELPGKEKNRKEIMPFIVKSSKSADAKLINFVSVYWDALKVCSFITKITLKINASHYILKLLGRESFLIIGL